MLHPGQKPRQSYVEQVFAHERGLKTLFVAASDYVRALPEQIARWLPGELFALGTDGMGRSETREALRRHFEVDAECIVVATLYRLHKQGVFDAPFVAKAIKELGVNPEKVDPYFA
jgi:pyruvate dehydrogenase E1 component